MYGHAAGDNRDESEQMIDHAISLVGNRVQRLEKDRSIHPPAAQTRQFPNAVAPPPPPPGVISNI